MFTQSEMLHEIVSLLKQESDAIQNIPVCDTFIKAVDLMYQKVHKEGGKVNASGMVKAGQTVPGKKKIGFAHADYVKRLQGG